MRTKNQDVYIIALFSPEVSATEVLFAMRGGHEKCLLRRRYSMSTEPQSRGVLVLRGLDLKSVLQHSESGACLARKRGANCNELPAE